MSSRSPIALLLLVSPLAANADLNPATLSAWNAYMRASETRIKDDATRNLLWVDQAPGRREKVRGGEIGVEPAFGKGARPVPHGTIHDWIGAVFIPNVKIADVLAVTEDYNRYADYYGPGIRSSKTLFRSEDVRSFEVLYVRKALFATVALDAIYEVRDFRVDDGYPYSIAQSTSIRQEQNYGEPNEHELPADDSKAFVWRTCSMARLEPGDGGVYFEQENMVLSRDIPAALHWIVAPFVERLSKSLIVGWLDQTRKAVLARKHA